MDFIQDILKTILFVLGFCAATSLLLLMMYVVEAVKIDRDQNREAYNNEIQRASNKESKP